jgi:hypothetical protein
VKQNKTIIYRFSLLRHENKEKSRKAVLYEDFDYIFERAFQIPPLQPKMRNKKDIGSPKRPVGRA